MQLLLKILKIYIVKKDQLLFSLKVKDKLMTFSIVNNFYLTNNQHAELPIKIVLNKEILEYKHQLFKVKLQL
jgi:hypothetical protein